MLLRLSVFTMFAFGLFSLVTVTWVATHPAHAPMAVHHVVVEPPRSVLVLGAASRLNAGTLVRPGDFVAVTVPAVPAGALADNVANRAALSGAMLRRGLDAGAPLLERDVMRPGDHGFLAAVLQPGDIASSIGVDPVNGVAGLIWPGDHVDVILTQEFGSQESTDGHRVAGETVLSDVRVIAIDQLIAHGIAPPAPTAGLARTVTLEVTPAQSRSLAVASRLGHLSLAVLSATHAVSTGKPEPVVTVWGSDVSPALHKSRQKAAGGGTLRLYQGGSDAKEFRF